MDYGAPKKNMNTNTQNLTSENISSVASCDDVITQEMVEGEYKGRMARIAEKVIEKLIKASAKERRLN